MGSQNDFKGGRFIARDVDDLRQLVALAAKRRDRAASQLGKIARNSTSLGYFVTGQKRGTRLLQLLEILQHHQFTIELEDLDKLTTSKITTVTDVQEALYRAVDVRGLKPDRARKDAGVGSNMVSFIRQTNVCAGPNANLDVSSLMPFMDHFNLVLVITDELSPVIKKQRQAELREQMLRERGQRRP